MIDDVAQERQEKLSNIHRKEEETSTERKANELGLNYINLSTVPVDRDSLNLIPESEARRTNTIIIQKKGKILKIGAVDPKNEETKQTLEKLKSQGFDIDLFMITKSSFERALKEFKFLPDQKKITEISGSVSLDKVEELKKEIKTFADLKEKISRIDQGNTSVLFEILLSSALILEASDIHIEPQEDKTKIRFRLDGVLQDAGDISHEIYRTILSRIKLLSGLQLNVENTPQDGRFTIKKDGAEIEIRTSIVPGAYGEYIVLRILNPNAIKLEVKDLGIRDYLWEKIEKEIKKPNGIILVTGPTGSGKTTTLYAFLKYLNKPGIKIITLEDPIEYHLEGIDQSQIETEKGYTFATGLRSILRQDPNIILVGETRDEETADVALHAALTGHLVFTTIHTNDAIGAIPRFLDINAKPQILASALNAAIGQRLVRKLCDECKKEIKNDSEIIEKIKKDLYSNPFVESALPAPKKIKIYEAVGCEKCGNTGYKGRIGVFEALFIDEKMEKLIDKNPTHSDVLEEAKKSGFITMYQDGLMRVLEGETTIEEVERVARATE